MYLGNGDGTFQTRTSYTAGGALRSVQTGDFNGDGIVDLVMTDGLSSKLSVLLGNGNGTFQTRVSYQVGSQPRSVNTGDFNGDGVLDSVSADSSSNQLSVLLGTTENGASPLLSFDLTTLSGATGIVCLSTKNPTARQAARANRSISIQNSSRH